MAKINAVKAFNSFIVFFIIIDGELKLFIFPIINIMLNRRYRPALPWFVLFLPMPRAKIILYDYGVDCAP